MSDFHTPVTCMQPQPMRTAAEHFRIAGANSFCYATLDTEGLVFVQGKGGKAVMREEEWQQYKALCLAPPHVISMRQQVADDEVPEWEDCAESPYVRAGLWGLRTMLAEAKACVQSAQRTLSVEDYGEALQAAERRLAESMDRIAKMMGKTQEKGGPEAA